VISPEPKPEPEPEPPSVKVSLGQQIAAEPSPAAPNPSPSVKASINLGALSGFAIDIFFFSSRQDFQETAISIQNKLRGYGLQSVRLRPYSLDKVDYLGICAWSDIRYEPNEAAAARKLKSLLGESVPEKDFSLGILEVDRYQGTTPSYLSIFLGDSETTETVYPREYDRMVWQNSCQETVTE
jgi:hypothetical protein